jgi:hypothetical protein
MYRTLPALAVALALSAGLFEKAAAQTNGAPERFSAVAFDMDHGTATPLQIAIERWTSDAETARLLSVLMDKGPTKLLDALQDAPKVGYIRTPTSLAWDLHFARRQPDAERGERITLATDRPMSIWETMNRPRSADYPFTVIEMHVNADGEGDGMLSYAAKLIPDKEGNLITIENYGTQPIRLQQVKRERPSQ